MIELKKHKCIFNQFFQREKNYSSTILTTFLFLTICRSLAFEGAKVLLAARQKDKLDRIVNDLKLAGVNPKNLIAFKCDITNRENVAEMIRLCVDKFSKIDVLVNCAGLMYYCMTKNGYTNEWRRMIDVNCHGTTNVIGEVVPHMIQQQSGHIINVG